MSEFTDTVSAVFREMGAQHQPEIDRYNAEVAEWEAEGQRLTRERTNLERLEADLYQAARVEAWRRLKGLETTEQAQADMDRALDELPPIRPTAGKGDER